LLRRALGGAHALNELAIQPDETLIGFGLTMHSHL
jgi:hypothetical protein